MDLWQLRTFEAVARTLNFTRASEDLNLSQPAVSHQIKALEKEVGKPLFERGSSGVSLTAAGQTMVGHAKGILDTAGSLLEYVEDSSSELKGKFVVSVTNQGLENPLDFLNEIIQKKYPLIEAVIHSARRVEDVISGVLDSSIDIGVVGDDLDLSAVATVPYGLFEMRLVVGRTHRFAEKEIISPEDLRDEDWVLYDSSSRVRAFTEECFAKGEFTPKSVYETNDGTLIRSIVARGKHISCLPTWGLENDIHSGAIVPLDVDGWEHKVQVNAVWKKNRKSKALAAVVEQMLASNYFGVTRFEEEDQRLQKDNG